MVATHATLHRRRDLPDFFASAQSLWSDLEAADGLVGYELQVSLTRGTLGTVSAWRDQTAMLTFAQGPAHRRVVEQTQHLVTNSHVHSWTATGRDLRTPAARLHPDEGPHGTD